MLAISPPAEKARPAPVITTHRTSRFSAHSSMLEQSFSHAVLESIHHFGPVER